MAKFAFYCIFIFAAGKFFRPPPPPTPIRGGGEMGDFGNGGGQAPFAPPQCSPLAKYDFGGQTPKVFRLTPPILNINFETIALRFLRSKYVRGFHYCC